MRKARRKGKVSKRSHREADAGLFGYQMAQEAHGQQLAQARESLLPSIKRLTHPSSPEETAVEFALFET